MPPTPPQAVAGSDAALPRILAAARKAAGVALVGSARAGISGLVVEAVGALAAPGRTVLRLRGRGRNPDSPAVTDLLAEPLAPGAGGLVVLRQALRGLAARTGTPPPVLVAEDAHLLDDVSVTLLLQALERRLVFLVAAVRTEDTAPTHLVPLWKDGLVARIDLAPPDGRRLPAPEPDVSTRQCWTLHLQGRLVDAERMAELAQRRAVERHRPAAAGAFATFLAHHLLLRGRPAAAERYAAAAVGLLAGRDEERAVIARACSVLARAARGDLTAARTGLARLHTERRPPGPARAAAARARAWVTALAGSPDQAASIIAGAVAEAAARGDLAWRLSLVHDLVRLGCGARATSALGELADHLAGDLAPAMAAHARALVADDGAGLDAAAGALARLGADLPAAEASAQAAATHRRRGEADVAAVSAARAQLWASRCEGASTPPLAGVTAVLSTRELQVARLVVTGESSRVMADRLGVSVRTVDNHLGRVYAKLGVTDRAGVRGLVTDGLAPPDDRVPLAA